MCLTVWREIGKSWLKLLLQNLAEVQKGGSTGTQRPIDTPPPPIGNSWKFLVYRKNGALSSPCNPATGAALASPGECQGPQHFYHTPYSSRFLYIPYLPIPLDMFMFNCWHPCSTSLLSTLKAFLSFSLEIIRKHFHAVIKPFGAFRKTIWEGLLIVTAIFLLLQISL